MKKFFLYFLVISLIFSVIATTSFAIVPEKNIIDKSLEAERDCNIVQDHITEDEKAFPNGYKINIKMTRSKYFKLVTLPAILIFTFGASAVVLSELKKRNKK